MDQVFSGNDVIITKLGCVGIITLNRPKSLNALNLDMIRAISVALEKWRTDGDIKAVYMDGAGERAFCAGGDIKHFYKAGMDYRRGRIALDTAMIFFQEEYDLNSQIFHYPKPLIAHMHGLTMGGGFGLAGNAQYKIVDPNTKFAMPEAKIGFFPDVGSMYHLKLLNNKIGLYLAMSGTTIAANDMVYCGLAEYVAKKDAREVLLSNLNEKLDNDELDCYDSVHNVLVNHKPMENGCALKEKENIIAKVFSGLSVSDILESASKYKELEDVYKLMLLNSPLSMEIAYEYYHRPDLESFNDIIGKDLTLATNFARGRDFYEGIRAAVIDKDKRPVWEAKTQKDVGFDIVKSYFSQ